MKKNVVVIHQPDFAPYLGFFHRFLQADMYIALDHVQFVSGSSRSWTNRDKIKTADGVKWLTVSVKKAPRETAINKVELAIASDWRRDNLNLLEQNYRNAPYYNEIIPAIERLYAQQFHMLSDFNMASIAMVMSMLDLSVPWVWSSDLQPSGSKNELLIDLLRKVKATHYLSGLGARAYLEPQKFSAAGIEVIWQQFNHPVYPQQYGEFVPFLSILDVFFNCGIVGARDLVRSCK